MKSTFFKFTFAAFFVFLAFAANFSANAQTEQKSPELSIAGFKLGGDEKATEQLLKGFSPRFDNEAGQPKYFFYNGYGNQVMSITCLSKEHPYLVVGVEVFAVGESYQKKHYQLKDTNSFMTESGFFIGAKPSVTSLMFAVPNVTKAKQIIKKKGVPMTDEKVDKVRTLAYRIDAVNQLENQEAKTEGINFGSYTAEYKFVKNKLRHITISVNTTAPATAKL